MLKIRYHHLNCLSHFEGKGYSSEFCRNMAEIKSRIEQGEKYKLVSAADDICAACPNLINRNCKDNSKALRYDALTKMPGYGSIENICSDCEWFEICKNK